MRGREVRVSSLITYCIQCYPTLFFMYPIVLAVQEMDMERTGWLMSVFFIATVIARPVGSLSAERWGVKRTMLVSGFALTAASAAIVFVSSFWGLMAVRASQGWFYGIYMLGLTAYQADVVPGKVRGPVYAAISVWYVIPQITLVPVADWLLERDMISMYLWLAPLIAMVCTCAATSVGPCGKKRTEESEDTRWGTWQEIFAVPGIWILVMSCFIFAVVNATGLMFIPSLTKLQGHLPSVFFAGVTITAVASRLVGKSFIDSREKRMYVLCPVVFAMTIAAVVVALASSNWVVFLGGCIYGVGMGYGFPVSLALVPDMVPVRMRPKGVTMGFFGLDMGWILSPIIVGYIGEYMGLPVATVIITMTGGVAGLLLWWFRWRPMVAACYHGNYKV